MGAQLAAHLTNAGVPVTLFDLTGDAARQGLIRLKSVRPEPFFTPDGRRLIQTAGFDDLSRLAHADWIIEAVIEDLGVKQGLLGRVAKHASSSAVLSSNTSAIPIRAIAEGLPAVLRNRLLGTHFFNPPRYLSLVEVIATPETDASVVQSISAFLDHRLGKGVVRAHDTPGFIANRLGMFGACRTLEVLASGEFTVEEIDAITGPPIGRPKSATFRTLDLAGLDIVAAVARDLSQRLTGADRTAFVPPPFIAAMLERGQVGVKTGRGFYTRSRDDASKFSRSTCRRSSTANPCPRGWPLSKAKRARRWPSASARCSSAAIASASCCGAPWGPRSFTRRRSPKRSPIRSTTSIAPCAGDLAGSSGRLKRGTPSASEWSSTRAQ